MSDDALKALVTEAMFRALDEKKREELIKSALAALVTPSQGHGYGTRPGPSALETAFEHAIRTVAFDVVKGMLATDEARARVRAVVAAAFEKMATDQDRLAQHMADAIVNAMRTD